MKITAIHAHIVRTRLDTPFAFSQGWVPERAAVIVEVVTDTGLVGWGEALCVGMQPGDIAAAAIRSVYAPMLAGRGRW
jgi:D-galactarolactone cycloisomerase